MLLEKALLDSSEKVPVESSINQQDEDLGDPIPVLIDADNASMSQYIKPLELR